MDDLFSYFPSGHFVVDGSACVSSCPPGKTEIEKNQIKQCETCIGLCPKGKVSIQPILNCWTTAAECSELKRLGKQHLLSCDMFSFSV